MTKEKREAAFTAMMQRHEWLADQLLAKVKEDPSRTYECSELATFFILEALSASNSIAAENHGLLGYIAKNLVPEELTAEPVTDNNYQGPPL